MAFVSVPYTFVNGTTADATQMNSNFTALINGLSDGTKDVTISKLVATSGTIGTVSATTVLATTVSAPTVNATAVNATTVSAATFQGTLVSATTVLATLVSAPTINAGVLNAGTVSATTFLGTLVSAATVNGTNIYATTISAPTINATVLNAGTVSATTFLGTLVSAPTINGTNINATTVSAATFQGTLVSATVVNATTVNVNSSGNNYVIIGTTDGTGACGVKFKNNSLDAWNIYSESGRAKLHFVDAASGYSRMTLDNTGKLSIGTATAGFKLDVVGTCNATTLLADSCTIGVINGTTVSATTFLGTLVSATTVLATTLEVTSAQASTFETWDMTSKIGNPSQLNILTITDTLTLVSPNVPASAACAGSAGNVVWDSGFIYVAVAANTWKRAALSTW